MMDCLWPRRVRQWGTPHSSSLSSICGRRVYQVTAGQQVRHLVHLWTLTKLATRPRKAELRGDSGPRGAVSIVREHTLRQNSERPRDTLH